MRLVILFSCSVLLSCQQKGSDASAEEVRTPTTEVSIEKALLVDSKTEAFDKISEPIKETVPVVDVSNQSVRILFAGTFHGDEVKDGADSLAWFGLYPADSGDFILQKTTVVAMRVFDGILDDEARGEMTGWEISTATDDYPTMLVWHEDLSEGFVNGLEIPQSIYPGDSIRIEFLGVHYLLHATGLNASNPDVGITQVSDYTLHIQRTDHGTTIHTTLVSHAVFDDAMTSILWSGDLDRDGYLDFLIDMSNHYNRSAPTLFLSKPTGSKDVVVPVAEHSSVGC